MAKVTGLRGLSKKSNRTILTLELFPSLHAGCYCQQSKSDTRMSRIYKCLRIARQKTAQWLPYAFLADLFFFSVSWGDASSPVGFLSSWTYRIDCTATLELLLLLFPPSRASHAETCWHSQRALSLQAHLRGGAAWGRPPVLLLVTIIQTVNGFYYLSISLIHSKLLFKKKPFQGQVFTLTTVNQ